MQRERCSARCHAPITVDYNALLAVCCPTAYIRQNHTGLLQQLLLLLQRFEQLCGLLQQLSTREADSPWDVAAPRATPHLPNILLLVAGVKEQHLLLLLLPLLWGSAWWCCQLWQLLQVLQGCAQLRLHVGFKVAVNLHSRQQKQARPGSVLAQDTELQFGVADMFSGAIHPIQQQNVLRLAGSPTLSVQGS